MQSPDQITTLSELEELVGAPGERALTKERSRLTDVDRVWLAATPFCVVATADAEGRCDASPKGDPPGKLAHVIDDQTIAIAERPGNRRVDGYRNLLANPHIGINFFIPGRGDTLRINGSTTLVSDGDFFDDLTVQGKRPILAAVVHIETIYFHCAKAFLRSGLWDPETWNPEAAPTRAAIAATLEPVAGESRADVEAYYDPANYGRELY